MANTHGGARKNSGRKLGVPTVRTREIAANALKNGVSPLEYMLSVMRDDAQSPLMRMDAAKSAAPYIHPRLNAIEHTGGLTLTHEQMLMMLAADPEDPDADDAVRAETTH